MYSSIKKYCEERILEFGEINSERKLLLNKISNYISEKRKENKPVNLIYICTHNSRRSHFGQIWAQVAAAYFDMNDVHSFSGGTEETAFHPNAIEALRKCGFEIKAEKIEKNPVYHLLFSEDNKSLICFSKKYDHKINPQTEFVAIITYNNAEQNCPFIPGVELRIGTTYDDPKAFDNTPLQDKKYSERCMQIARETFYVFSKAKELMHA